MVRDITKEESDTDAFVVISLFAFAREIIGKDKIKLKMKDKMVTVYDLRRAVVEMYPSLSIMNNRFLVAVNHKVADNSTVVSHLDEVAILPPISGGSY